MEKIYAMESEDNLILIYHYLSTMSRMFLGKKLKKKSKIESDRKSSSLLFSIHTPLFLDFLFDWLRFFISRISLRRNIVSFLLSTNSFDCNQRDFCEKRISLVWNWSETKSHQTLMSTIESINHQQHFFFNVFKFLSDSYHQKDPFWIILKPIMAVELLVCLIY